MSTKVKVDEVVLKHVVNYLSSLLKISKTPSVGLLRLAIDVCHVCGYVKDITSINVESEEFTTCMNMIKKVLQVLQILGITEVVEPGVVNVLNSEKLLQLKKKVDKLGEKVEEYVTKTIPEIPKELKEVKKETKTNQVQGLQKKITIKKEVKKETKTTSKKGADITKFFT